MKYIAGFLSGLILIVLLAGNGIAGNESAVLIILIFAATILSSISYAFGKQDPNSWLSFPISSSILFLLFIFGGDDFRETLMLFTMFLTLMSANILAAATGSEKINWSNNKAIYLVPLVVIAILFTMLILDNAKPSSEKSDVGTSILNTEIQMAEGDKVESGTDSLP